MALSKRAGTILGTCCGVGFIVTAGLHSLGFKPVTALAQQAPDELRPIVPLLWLSFSADLVVAGLVVLIATRRPGPSSSLLMAVAGVMPAAAAALQVAYLGVIAPAVILSLLAVSTWLAAWAARERG